MRTVVLIPCYNEAPTIEGVVRGFKALDPGLTVYVCDNNSTDDSASLAAAAGAVVVCEHRQGKGHVIRSMFRDIDADCYVMVDGDGTYSAQEALAMAELVLDGSADMVVGDRLSGDYFRQNTRRFHGVGNRLVRALVNRIFRSHIKDIMTGSRAFSRRFVKAFPVTTGGFEIETEMTIHALDKDFIIREIPITYRERAAGSQSKLDTYSDGLRVLRTIVLLFRDYRPFQFFGLISAALFALCVLFFLPPLEEYLRTGYVARVPTLVVSIALGISSLLSLVCGVVLDSMRAHSRQFYEMALTAIAEGDRREAGRNAQ